MQKIFNPYINLTNYIIFEIKKIFDLEVTATIQKIEEFKNPDNWIYLDNFFPIAISDNIKSLDDSNYKIIALLLKIPGFFSSNWKLLLNKPKSNFDKVFKIGIYNREHLSQIFSFKLAMNTKYLNTINYVSQINDCKNFKYRKKKKIKLLSNTFSPNTIRENDLIKLDKNNLHILVNDTYYSINKLNIDQNLLLKTGDKMENKIPLNIELGTFEVSFDEFNQLGVDSEISINIDSLKSNVLKIGKNKYALTSLIFNENEILIKIDEILDAN